jgi:hypothetical protein
MSSTSSAADERFQTGTTILIAIVSTAIALVASQAAVTMGQVTEAEHNGVLAKINLERVDGSSRIRLTNYLRAFDEYRFSRVLQKLTAGYIPQAVAAGEKEYETRLRQEAAARREESDIALDFVHLGYVDSNSQGEYTHFRNNEFLDDERAGAEIYQDLDPQDNFAEANTFRTQALLMSASLIVLFVSIMFLTWAQITHSPLRWVWLGAGLLLAVGTGLAYLLNSIVGLMGV